MLTYALRNADCHAKNIALFYSTRADVRTLSRLRHDHDRRVPGLPAQSARNQLSGKKTWVPGKSLEKFIASVFGVPARTQVEIVETISDAVSDIAPRVREAMTQHADFADIGKRMLLAWSEGIHGAARRACLFPGEVERESGIRRLFRSAQTCKTRPGSWAIRGLGPAAHSQAVSYFWRRALSTSGSTGLVK